MTPKKTVIAFDLYGTLLSTESIAHELAKYYGENVAKSLAALWRRYQLEYTWRINSMGEYKPFNELTLNALHHAAAEHGLSVPADAAEALMRSYDALHAFPEVPGALDLLHSTVTANADADAGAVVEAYIFSNGTDAMVRNSVRTSPDLAAHLNPPPQPPSHSGSQQQQQQQQPTFKDLVTVDELRCYKPDPRVYAHLVERASRGTGKGTEAETERRVHDDVWVVSANPFDIVGARAAGLNAAFVDRSGRGWVDRLDGARRPTVVVGGVDGAVKAILERLE